MVRNTKYLIAYFRSQGWMKLGKKYGFDHFSFYVANMILGLHYTNI